MLSTVRYVNVDADDDEELNEEEGMGGVVTVRKVDGLVK